MAKTEAGPNLEDIASGVAHAEEKYSMDQLLPSLYDAFLSSSKNVDESGKVTYKTKFSDKEKEKLADDMFEKLSYHVHINIYGMTQAKWEELKTMKDPSGVPYTDVAVQRYFGITRDALIKSLKKQNKITSDTIGSIGKEMMEHHKEEINKLYLGKLEEKDVPAIKEWLKSKVKEYSLDPELGQKIAEMYSLNEIIPVYLGVASQHYKGEKEKKKPATGT